ncbi:MAG: hypothetical protein ACOYZ8_06455 [Chloroflexota bacterium]
MFNDRDLGILGAGALLAVLSLFLPFPFAGKVVTGFLVLVAFMALALLRLGPDRVPPEVWLMRRFRYEMQARQYVNQQTASRRTQNAPAPREHVAAKSSQTERRSSPIPTPVIRPVDLAWNEIGIYPLLTAFLAVVGIYFAFWLANGGAEELSIVFRQVKR